MEDWKSNLARQGYPDGMKKEIRYGQCPDCGREGGVLNMVNDDHSPNPAQGKCYVCFKADVKELTNTNKLI